MAQQFQIVVQDTTTSAPIIQLAVSRRRRSQSPLGAKRVLRRTYASVAQFPHQCHANAPKDRFQPKLGIIRVVGKATKDAKRRPSSPLHHKTQALIGPESRTAQTPKRRITQPPLPSRQTCSDQPKEPRPQ